MSYKEVTIQIPEDEYEEVENYLDTGFSPKVSIHDTTPTDTKDRQFIYLATEVEDWRDGIFPLQRVVGLYYDLDNARAEINGSRLIDAQSCRIEEYELKDDRIEFKRTVES